MASLENALSFLATFEYFQISQTNDYVSSALSIIVEKVNDMITSLNPSALITIFQHQYFKCSLFLLQPVFDSFLSNNILTIASHNQNLLVTIPFRIFGYVIQNRSLIVANEYMRLSLVLKYLFLRDELSVEKALSEVFTEPNKNFKDDLQYLISLLDLKLAILQAPSVIQGKLSRLFENCGIKISNTTTEEKPELYGLTFWISSNLPDLKSFDSLSFVESDPFKIFLKTQTISAKARLEFFKDELVDIYFILNSAEVSKTNIAMEIKVLKPHSDPNNPNPSKITSNLIYQEITSSLSKVKISEISKSELSKSLFRCIPFFSCNCSRALSIDFLNQTDVCDMNQRFSKNGDLNNLSTLSTTQNNENVNHWRIQVSLRIFENSGKLHHNQIEKHVNGASQEAAIFTSMLIPDKTKNSPDTPKAILKSSILSPEKNISIFEKSNPKKRISKKQILSSKRTVGNFEKMPKMSLNSLEQNLSPEKRSDYSIDIDIATVNDGKLRQYEIEVEDEIIEVLESGSVELDKLTNVKETISSQDMAKAHISSSESELAYIDHLVNESNNIDSVPISAPLASKPIFENQKVTTENQEIIQKTSKPQLVNSAGKLKSWSICYLPKEKQVEFSNTVSLVSDIGF
ncbi:hypothetical protein HK096_004310 [Nowakowskiella sp. JEL0078]|nr:hypothetical protein HK096_004310 [Nowakowskiella sp. JEL0078]